MGDCIEVLSGSTDSDQDLLGSKSYQGKPVSMIAKLISGYDSFRKYGVNFVDTRDKSFLRKREGTENVV